MQTTIQAQFAPPQLHHHHHPRTKPSIEVFNAYPYRSVLHLAFNKQQARFLYIYYQASGVLVSHSAAHGAHMGTRLWMDSSLRWRCWRYSVTPYRPHCAAQAPRVLYWLTNFPPICIRFSLAAEFFCAPLFFCQQLSGPKSLLPHPACVMILTHQARGCNS